MAVWQDLDDELDAWAGANRTAAFWWRDDDLEASSDGLDALLALRRGLAIPVALAAIPATAQPALSGLLRAESDTVILQHGYDHANRAPPGAKKAEFAASRSQAQVVGQLIEGRTRLGRMFGDRFRPILVPPWNRIDAELVALLPKAGFIGLSAFAGRRPENPVQGLPRADCHVDVIDWRGGRDFVGVEAALDQALKALSDLRRMGSARAVGILTHHRVMDRPAWDFLAALAGRVVAKGTGRWIAVDQALC